VAAVDGLFFGLTDWIKVRHRVYVALAPSTPRRNRHSARFVRYAGRQDDLVREYVGPPLTRTSLARLLGREGIRERSYSLFGARRPEAIVLDQRPGGRWVVFYTERGEESALRTYDNEAEACLDMLERVWNYEWNRFTVVAGPAPPDEADAAFDEWLQDHDLSLKDLAADDWRTQDSAWKVGEPDYRRYWVRISRIRDAS
jgi:hypothetical protein